MPQPQPPPPHPLANRPSHHFESDRPDVHHPYQIGPDPFPDYFPQTHPHYHFNLDHYDDKVSHHFPGNYAPNAPSMHNSDRYYPHSMENFYGPSGRYPDSGYSYNPNRKNGNGYQVTENAPDVPNSKRE